MMARLTAIVLGSAAGGGFPQWNCRCPVCLEAWNGVYGVLPRTQASLAVTGDGRSWTLLNASPDIRSQIAATVELHPRGTPRGSPIGAVVLTGAEIDQIAGLLTLRERGAFTIFATAETLAMLVANPIFEALDASLVRRTEVVLGHSFPLPGGLTAELFPITGKVPLYLEATASTLSAPAGGNVGVTIAASGARLVFAPGAGAIDAPLGDRLHGADVVLFDGTLFTDDEMIRAGLSEKTGLRMGHLPVDGTQGSLAALADLPGRRIYIHINNSNPLLLPHSAERRTVEASGWEIAHDGLRIEL